MVGATGATGAGAASNATSVMFGRCAQPDGLPDPSLCVTETLGRVFVCTESTFIYKCRGDGSIAAAARSLFSRAPVCSDAQPCWEFSGDLTRKFLFAQDYFIWLLVLSVVLALVAAYSTAHLIHYLLHLRKTNKEGGHNFVFPFSQSDPFSTVVMGNDDPRASQMFDQAAVEQKKSSSGSQFVRMRGRDRNQLALENDRVVRKSPREAVIQRHSGLESVAPMRHDELAPLDPGEMSQRNAVRESVMLALPAELMPEEAAVEDHKSEGEEEDEGIKSVMFGDTPQDPFASLLLSPRSALEKTQTIPRGAGRRAGVTGVFGGHDEDDSQSSVSREAGLQMAATLGDDRHDAEEERYTQRGSMQRTSIGQLFATEESPQPLVQHETDLQVEAIPEHDEHVAEERRSESEIEEERKKSEEATLGAMEDSVKVESQDGSTANVDVMTAAKVEEEVRENALPEPVVLEPVSVVEPVEVEDIETLEPMGTVLTELTGPVRLVREEVLLPPIIELDQTPRRATVAAVQPMPFRSNSVVAPRPVPQRGPKVKLASRMQARAPVQAVSPKQSLAAPREESDDSASFDDYSAGALPEPPKTEDFSALLGSTSNRLLPEPPSDSPRVVSMPAPPDETPQVMDSMRGGLPPAPQETPRFEVAKETPRFVDPPASVRREYRGGNSESFDSEDETLPEPPKSEVFRTSPDEGWIDPPSEEEHSMDRPQLEDSADAPDTPQNDPHSARPPSATSSWRNSAIMEELELPLTQPRANLLGSLRGQSEEGISGRRPTTLRSAAELAMPEMELPETFSAPRGISKVSLRASEEAGISGRRPSTLRSAAELDLQK